MGIEMLEAIFVRSSLNPVTLSRFEDPQKVGSQSLNLTAQFSDRYRSLFEA
jgi:hypothetical protein